MKKTLSTVLAVLMIFVCLPFAVGAEPTPTLLDNDYLNDNFDIFSNSVVLSGGRFVIPQGETVVMPENETLYINSDATLEVYGTLNARGKIISRGGLFILKLNPDGTPSKLLNGFNVGGNSEDYYLAEIRFADLPADFTANEHHISDSKLFVSSNGHSYADLGTESSFTAFSFGEVQQVRLHQYLFFKMKLVAGDGVEKYDSKFLKFTFNGENITNEQNVHKTEIVSAGTVSLKATAWNEETYLRRFNIYLPSGVGYEVFGKNGEVSAETETVVLKYGQEFMFRVQVDPQYSNSEYEVYCINNYQWNDERFLKNIDEHVADTENLSPAQLLNEWNASSSAVIKYSPDNVNGFIVDENGYYCIPGEYLIRDCTIIVKGVVKNDTLNFAAKILVMLKSIFEGIRAFFGNLFGR